jgi:capping protein alpha
MSEKISMDEKLKIAHQFILESPPGELDDVFNDIIVLLDVDDYKDLLPQFVKSFQEYNNANFIPVEIPNQSTKAIISKFGMIDDEHYLDPRSGNSFAFDHFHQKVDDVQKVEIEENEEFQIREAVDKEIQKYVTDHFPNGVSAVYYKENKMTIIITANKYNPDNFWNGRWRSIYHINTENNEVSGYIKSNVHYYEDGNVQLEWKKDTTFELKKDKSDPTAFAKAIAKGIEEVERNAEISLKEAYEDQANNVLKALRRALPITKQKMDWNQISYFKLGNELNPKNAK